MRKRFDEPGNEARDAGVMAGQQGADFDIQWRMFYVALSLRERGAYLSRSERATAISLYG
jgi:hypothetical protein